MLPRKSRCLQPFVAAATARAGGGAPRIPFVWVDEGDGTTWSDRWMALVAEVGPVDGRRRRCPDRRRWMSQRLDGAHGLFVCGGLTPAYADSARTRPQHSCGGSSSRRGCPTPGRRRALRSRHVSAVVGGYLDGERVVCPADAAEDLEQVTVVPGLGLVDEMVDVHASAWGTLPRLAAALSMTPDVAAGARTGRGHRLARDRRRDAGARPQRRAPARARRGWTALVGAHRRAAMTADACDQRRAMAIGSGSMTMPSSVRSRPRTRRRMRSTISRPSAHSAYCTQNASRKSCRS